MRVGSEITYTALNFHLPRECTVDVPTQTATFRKPKGFKESGVIEVSKDFAKGYDLIHSTTGRSSPSERWREYGLLGRGYFKLAVNVSLVVACHTRADV